MSRIIDSKTEPTTEFLRAIADTPDDGRIRRRYQWTAEVVIEVDDLWVADGFDITDERLSEMVSDGLYNDLCCAHSGVECAVSSARVTSAPDPAIISVEQGGPVP